MKNALKRNLIWIVGLTILVLATIFAFQNFTTVEVRLFVFRVSGPLFFVIVMVFILGVLLGRIWGFLSHLNKSPKKDVIKPTEETKNIEP